MRFIYKNRIVGYIERLYYRPTALQLLFTSFLLPLSWIYEAVVRYKRLNTKVYIPPIPTISIGNIVIGGSGKTPTVISIASKLENAAVVMRGYGRKSKGLFVVSNKGEIECDVQTSGDEAMLIAQSLPDTSVIVSEDRVEGIKKAYNMGAKVVLLDDGFAKAIKKLDILLMPDVLPNKRTLPIGPFKEPLEAIKYADIVLKENIDYKPRVKLTKAQSGDRYILVTAIAKPWRLDRWLPDGVVGKIYLPDHSKIEESMLKREQKRYNATKILMTQKDYVKCKDFNLPIALLEMEMEIDTRVFDKIYSYIKDYKI